MTRTNRTARYLLALAALLFAQFASDARAQTPARASSNGAAHAAATAPAPALPLTLPNKKDSVHFAVIGDTGTGTDKQYELGRVLTRYREVFPYDFVLMMGDNLYNGETAQDYKKKFSDVYRVLLDGGVKFYATLGNHDESNQRFYKDFNMDGNEYYNFKKGAVSFYSLNSNYMDKKQLDWLVGKLSQDTSDWKIVYFHHPPYSSGGKHGSDTKLREVVEPIFLKYGVSAVFAGHEHFYERIKPQKGIYYFISGAGGKLRDGDVKEDSPLSEKGYDKDMSFMLLEIDGADMHFQVINRLGETVDSGVVTNQRKKAAGASQ